MRQTVPTILLARNDVINHRGVWYRIVETRIQPCPLFPKLIVWADEWPHESQRVTIDLDADSWTSRAVS